MLGALVLLAVDALSVTASSVSGAAGPYTNATTSAPYAVSTSPPNATATRTWSLWATANYPSDCDAYYTAAGASPSALPKWNASQNAVFFSSAYGCLSSLYSYADASRTWQSSHIYEWLSTSLSAAGLGVETETISTTMYKLTTLCDGYARAVTGPSASSTVSTYTTQVTYRSTSTIETYVFTTSVSTAPYTTLPPTCSLNCAACSMLNDAADYTVSSQVAQSIYGEEILFPFDCPYAPNPDDTNKDGSPDCQVDVYSAQMFYWPITTVNGDICNKTGTTITPTPTGDGPNTFVINDTVTLTSPTVYVSFHNLSYVTVHFNNTEQYVTNTLMGFEATEIQSQRGYHGSDGNYSFNYADLPPNPVPASAWFGQVPCWFDRNACIPIATAAYGPGLAFPSVFFEMSNFNPKWTASRCALGVENDGIWDPPVACQSVTSADGPSVPVAYTTTSSASTTSPAAPIAYTTSSGPVQTSNSAGTTSSYTAIADNTPPTTNTPSPAGSTSPQAPSASPSDDTAPSPASSNTQSTGEAAATAPDSTPAASQGLSSSAQSVGTESSDDVGGIIASAFGISRTSAATTAEHDPQTEAASSGEATASDPAGALASVLAQGTTGAAAQDPTAQGSSIADPVTADPNDPTPSPASEYSAAFTLGSSTLSAMVQPSGNLVVSGTTYTPGQTFPLGTQTASLNTGGVVVDGTSTIAFSPPNANTGAAQTAVITDGGTTFTAVGDGSGAVVVGGTTLTAGGAAVTVASQVFSAASSGLIIDGTRKVAFSTIAGATADSAQTAIVTGGGSTFTAVQEDPGTVAVGGTTLIAGEAAVTIAGQVFSAAPSGLVIDGTSTAAFSAIAAATPNAPETAIVTAGGSTFTAIQEGPGTVVVGGSTLTVGGAAVTLANSQVFSEAASGLVVDGTSTIAFTTIADATPNAAETTIITAGGSTFTAIQEGPGTVVVGGSTLTVGGAAVTLANSQVFSEAASRLVVDGTNTVAFSSGPDTASSTGSAPASAGGSQGSVSAPSGPSTTPSSGSMGGPRSWWPAICVPLFFCFAILR
ncbi:hypothetical protein LTR53_002766 [Teratosphaeriaceae sp. CCFEE 6253]|nr:hypothetical protein LTR53_002766 [Teratosphaeriaceae sp. CCFEE 6253]